MKKQVELLAPAGNFQCFQAAINAGADAVYLGGDKFGARAYADNFNKEELLRAIEYGHLFHKKIYLTLNTLLKDEELALVTDYLKPFYEAGLDGVIIQDFGVLSLLKEQFPGLELHASTQMTVTGKEGAAFLKEYGVSRIVPARELSLEEIKKIKNQVDIEIETFIHGAMCYGYSGQCLFSSMLGGRSGNRGRCAGPCRLPYDAFYKGKQINEKKEQYLLSLKDMCSISLLPKLIEAGIDSFKIEGRMKSAEYVAGVTSIYRTYIDRYEKEKESFHIKKEDIELLKKLYVRSELETGYYEKHHGASMVTLQKPCYETGSKEELKTVTKAYLTDNQKLPIYGTISLIEGKLAELCFETEEKQGGVSVIAKGGNVQTASNRPIDEAMVRKQISKMGGTIFELKKLDVVLEGNCFVSVKELNDLRRQGTDTLLKKLLTPFQRTYVQPLKEEQLKESYPIESDKEATNKTKKESYHIVVAKEEQLKAVVAFIKEQEKEENRLFISKVSISSDVLYANKDISKELMTLKESEIELSITFPKVVRANTLKKLEKTVLKRPELSYISSFLVGNLELFSYFKKNYPGKVLYGDYSLYSFNSYAYEFLKEQGIKEVCMPYEWSRHEMKAYKKAYPASFTECIIYSYIPLMESVGCILKTTKKGAFCGNSKESIESKKQLYLLDRYKKKLPVLTHCDRCENTIYNSVPYSLYKELLALKEMGIYNLRMDFTIETKDETIELLQYFRRREDRKQPFLEFTKGHFGKGVE